MPPSARFASPTPLALTILVWLLMVTFLWLALIRDKRVAS